MQDRAPIDRMTGSSLPTVSAVMLTGKTAAHERLARVAVRCFLEQTYPAERRELLIISDGGYRLAPSFPLQDANGRSLVREVHLDQRPNKIGDLRNLGLDNAWGDYVIQWDDDDWHGPDRISIQTRPLVDQPGKECTFLRRQVRYSMRLNSAFVYSADRIHGTILHRRTDLRYPSLHIAEDTAFMSRWISHHGRQTICDIDYPAGECDNVYVRLHHGRNTWNRLHIMGIATLLPGVWLLPKPAKERLQKVLSEYYGMSVEPGMKPEPVTEQV